jgi:hypothetical protein
VRAGAVLGIFGVLASCEPDLPTPTQLIGRRATTTLAPSDPHPWLAAGVFRPTPPVVLDGRLALLGARLDDNGSTVRGTAWLLVVGELAGRLKPELTVDVGHETLTVPLVAALHPLEWRRGDVVAADFAVTPKGGSGPIGIGVADAGRRWPGGPVVVGHRTTDTTGSTGTTGTTAQGEVLALRRHDPIVIDGVLDEADWQRAMPVTLRPWKTGATVSQATTLRLLWDDDALWVAFDVDDDDPHSPYTTRDEPLYESEALEVFIDADFDRDVYVELQASPTNVHFDAAFSGGARKGMDVGWNAPIVTATTARPGGYVQEWQIPVAGLRDVPAGEPRAGARWAINVFRLERRRQGAQVTGTEASALSPPERGDFHALDRFGALIFQP